MSTFWWRNKRLVKKVHWTKWTDLQTTKGDRGVGFRDIECFNQTILAKQGWRLFIFPSSLVPQVINYKYFRRMNFMEAKLGANPSLIWRSILETSGLLVKEGLKRRVGNGDSINIWQDNWLIDLCFLSRRSVDVGVSRDTKVRALINRKEGCLNKFTIFEFSGDEMVEVVCKIPFSRLA